jgi:hypothetical protein
VNDSVLVNSVLSEPSISESENPVKESKFPGNFLAIYCYFLKLPFLLLMMFKKFLNIIGFEAVGDEN